MFKLKRWLALLAIGVIGGITFGNVNGYKAQATRKTSNTIVVNNDTTVSSKYSFIFRWIPGKTTAQVFNSGQGSFKSKRFPSSKNDYGGMHYLYFLKSRNDLGKFGIIYHNIGTYQGKTVDLKITMTDYDPKSPNSAIEFAEGVISLNTQFMSFAKVRWDFYDAKTNEKIKINGYITIVDIDNSQGVTFDAETSKHIQNVLISNDTFLDVVKNSNGELSVQDSSSHATEPSAKNGRATILFNNADNLTFKWCAHNKDHLRYDPDKTKGKNQWGGDWFGYTEEKLARTELITPEKYIQSDGNKVKEKTISSDDEVEYSLLHKVPDEVSDFYYRSYELKDEVPDCLKIKNYGIYDETGQNVNNLFDNKTSGNSIHYVAKKDALARGSFYGHDYYVKIKADVYKPNLNKYKIGHDIQIKNNFTVTADGKTKKSNDAILKIKHQSPPAPTKTASVDKVSFDGKPFTYDVKQQVNNLNLDIFEKYSQMSFDDKIPDSLKVNDVKILDGDGKDVKDGAGKLSTSYNGEKNHVHFDFNKNYLDSMKMNGETHTMRISCTYVAHKLYGSEKEINNTATVNINDEPKTASVKINVPSNDPQHSDSAFSKETATKTFDGTKDQTVSYTLKADYGNLRSPWGSSLTDNMPDNCTLDVSSIKAQYVDKMNGAKKENINVNDYFTNKSTDKQLKLVMNKSKDGTTKFINSQLIVKYNMKIKGNAVWSGGYKDNDGKAYYNSQTDKIDVPNVATFIDSQDNGQTFNSKVFISTSARHAGLTKRANVGSFDYSKDQTVKYSLNADFGNLHNPMGALLEDNLPDNCTLDRNSVKATRIASDGTTHNVNITDFFANYSTDKKIKLVLNKGNANEFVNSKLVVTYDMKIKGNSDWSNYYDKDTHKIRVPNSATFIDGQGGQKFTDTISVTTDCQEPSITAYIAQDDNNFVRGTKKVHYSEHSGDSSTKAVTVAYKIVVGNYLKLRQLEVKSSVPNGFRVVSSTLRNSLTNANEGFGYQNHTNLNADNVSDNCPHIQDHGERAQSWVGKTAYWIVKTNASVANYAKYANLANNTGAFRGEMLTGAGNYGKDPWHYSNTVGAILPNIYEYQPLASERFADGTLKYYAKVKGLAVNAQAPTSFSNQGQPVKLNNATVTLPDGIKTSQSRNIVASMTSTSKNANVTATNDLNNPNKVVVITNKNCETKAVDDGIRNDFDSQPKTITKANTLYLNPYKQINYYDYDNHVIARKNLNEAYVFNAKYEHPKAKGGYGIVNPNGLMVVGFSNPESENVQNKYKTIFTDRDNITDVGYLAKHGNSYTEALDFDKSVKTVDEKSIDSVLSKGKLNMTDKTKNLKQDVLGYETGADGKETHHELKLSRENELHLTPQAYALHIDYKFNHKYLDNGKQLFVNADNRYSNYNSNNGSVTTGDDGGNRLYLKNWLKDGDYQTNYSLNSIGYRNRMSLNLNQPIQIYGRRYLSKTRGFNTGGEISVQPTISDSNYHVSGGNADLQGWLGSY